MNNICFRFILKPWSQVGLVLIVFLNSSCLQAQEKLDTLWVYDGWHKLNWGLWAIDKLYFKPIYTGDHIFVIDSIWDEFSQQLSGELVVNGKIVRYDDAYYFNYSEKSWEPEDFGMFVRMDIVGHYSIILLPEKRGEIELYKSRLVHCALFHAIGSLVGLIGEKQRIFKDVHGHEYKVIIFDPRLKGDIKGPRRRCLSRSDLENIIQTNKQQLDRNMALRDYSIEDIFEVLIHINRLNDKSFYEGNIDYLRQF